MLGGRAAFPAHSCGLLEFYSANRLAESGERQATGPPIVRGQSMSESCPRIQAQPKAA